MPAPLGPRSPKNSPSPHLERHAAEHLDPGALERVAQRRCPRAADWKALDQSSHADQRAVRLRPIRARSGRHESVARGVPAPQGGCQFGEAFEVPGNFQAVHRNPVRQLPRHLQQLGPAFHAEEVADLRLTEHGERPLHGGEADSPDAIGAARQDGRQQVHGGQRCRGVGVPARFIPPPLELHSALVSRDGHGRGRDPGGRVLPELDEGHAGEHDGYAVGRDCHDVVGEQQGAGIDQRGRGGGLAVELRRQEGDGRPGELHGAAVECHDSLLVQADGEHPAEHILAHGGEVGLGGPRPVDARSIARDVEGPGVVEREPQSIRVAGEGDLHARLHLLPAHDDGVSDGHGAV